MSRRDIDMVKKILFAIVTIFTFVTIALFVLYITDKKDEAETPDNVEVAQTEIQDNTKQETERPKRGNIETNNESNNNNNNGNENDEELLGSHGQGDGFVLELEDEDKKQEI